MVVQERVTVIVCSCIVVNGGGGGGGIIIIVIAVLEHQYMQCMLQPYQIISVSI